MHRKNAQNMRVYWQGPSLGFDLGTPTPPVFTLVYNIGRSGQIFQRYPASRGTSTWSAASA
jgi:hypothetical protein